MIPTYEELAATYTEIRKAQWVRLLDVYVLGPMTVLVSLFPIPLPLRLAMGAYGLATIYYNHRNYVATRERVAVERQAAEQRAQRAAYEAQVDQLVDQLVSSYQVSAYPAYAYVS